MAQFLKDTETPDERRRRIREAVARNKSMMDQMTRLEQAAYRERKHLGRDYQPYTPGELKEAEAIRALISEAQGRASRLHDQITRRLERDRGGDGARLLDRFRNEASTRVELAPF